MTPIFIGGCERSGTTMLGSLVGGHDACLTTPAAQFLTDTARGYGEAAAPDDLPKILKRITCHPHFRAWSIFPPKLEHERELADLYNTLFRAYANDHKPDAQFWVTHSPANIRHGPSLSRLFPGAKFLHIIRDGRAIAASMRKLPAGKVTMRDLALLWAERLSHGLAIEHSLGPQNVLRVRYEDLLRDTEVELRRIAAFLGLEYQQTMAEGKGFRVGGTGGHALVGQAPLETRSVAWQRELSPREVELFEFYSAELLELLGYEPHYGLAAAPPSPNERVHAVLASGERRVRDLVRKAGRRLLPRG